MLPQTNHTCPPSNHACPQATMHAPHSNHAHPPRSNHACPPAACLPWEQPCMPPGSNHACPPGSNHACPPSNHACPQEQPCMPPQSNHAGPPYGQNVDTRFWKYYLAPTSLRVVIKVIEFWFCVTQCISTLCLLKGRAVVHFHPVQSINEPIVSVIVINARGRNTLDGAVSLRDNSCEPFHCVGRTMSITHNVIRSASCKTNCTLYKYFATMFSFFTKESWFLFRIDRIMWHLICN